MNTGVRTGNRDIALALAAPDPHSLTAPQDAAQRGAAAKKKSREVTYILGGGRD